jgi:hypothetical protein
MRHEHAAANSASQESMLKYRQFADVGVTSGTIHVCNGNRYLYTLGNTYSPVGGLGGIEKIEAPSDSQPKTLRMWLAAVSSSNMFNMGREDMFNKPVTIRYGYVSNVTNALVSTPSVLWKGNVNQVELHFADEEKGNYFEIEAETSLRSKSEVINFNKETHETVMAQSGDTFFTYIDKVPLTKALWGNQPTTFNGDRGADSFISRIAYMIRYRRKKK